VFGTRFRTDGRPCDLDRPGLIHPVAFLRHARTRPNWRSPR
jgi:hypothetical protein